jgi:hypothetical protein
MATYENGVQLVYGLSYNELLLRGLKSVPLAFIKGFFFGPFGVFYSSIALGVISVIAFLVVGSMVGIYIFLAWPFFSILSAFAARYHNKQLWELVQ